MALHDTTARETATERLLEAKKNIKALKAYLDQVDEAIDNHEKYTPGVGFHIEWGNGIMKGALAIFNEIARCNGATLVRATEPTRQVICERSVDELCSVCGASFPFGRTTCDNGHLSGNKYAI
jgi:hypothetical protein